MGRYNIELAELRTWHIAFSSFTLFIGAFICVNLLTPIVIWVSVQKRLVTPVNRRSSHHTNTPPFGGVVFYIIFVVFISLIQLILSESIGYNIIAATSILFMIGLKDDLIHSTARVKLFAQLLAGMFTVCSDKFRILNELLLGYHLDQIWSPFVSALLLILIINAYNLIDGIDGLAAMIGMVVCMVYALLFFLDKDVFFFLLSVVTLGMLSAFLRFNTTSKRLKIFMGDCGSLTIGLIIGLCTLRFLSASSINAVPVSQHLGYRLILMSAILFIPLLDTFRIIVLRVLQGKSPFRADKNHIHHVLISQGLSHLKASIILTVIQVAVVVFVFSILERASLPALFVMVLLLYLLGALIFHKIACTDRA